MELQQMIESLNRESEARGLTTNKKKTKISVMSKQKKIPQSNILVNGEKLQQVDHFECLDCMITSDNRCDAEISRTIAMMKWVFWKKKNILTDKSLSIAVKLRLLKCYVW